MSRFKNIGLFTNSVNKQKFLIGRQIEEILKSKKCKVFYDNSFISSKFTSGKAYTSKYLMDKCDLIIAIGGDGTMLSCSRLFGPRGIPILGINLGELGFLTDIAPDELTTKLIEVISGSHELDERFFLQTKIKGKRKYSIALNEVVIHSGAIAKMIEYDLYIDNQFVLRQKADGLIISTPTGSTAYSLSGGGPIVHPNLEVISLIPMFPHSLSSSPFVISAESQIKISIVGKDISSQLSLDSHDTISLEGESEIHIRKSASVLNLIHPLDHDFYDGCRNKLGWSSSIVKPKN